MLSVQVSELDQASNKDYNFVGITKPFNSPYNFFLKLEEVVDPDADRVDFFVYVMGQSKVVAWGYYRKSTRTFTFDGQCKYNVQHLSEMNKLWRSNGFTSAGNSVRDRIKETVSSYVGGEDVRKTDASQRMYEEKKFILALLVHHSDDLTLTEAELEAKYPGAIERYNTRVHTLCVAENQTPIYDANDEVVGYDSPDIECAVSEAEYAAKVLVKMQAEVDEYEASINRTDLSPLVKVMQQTIQDAVHKITTRFYEELRGGQLEEQNLAPCPLIAECDISHDPLCGVYKYGQTESAQRGEVANLK